MLQGPSVAQEEAELAALNEQEAQDLEAEGERGEANGDGHEWLDDEDSVSEFQATRREINMLNSCRRVGCFERLNRISEGTYGVVYRYYSASHLACHPPCASVHANAQLLCMPPTHCPERNPCLPSQPAVPTSGCCGGP